MLAAKYVGDYMCQLTYICHTNLFQFILKLSVKISGTIQFYAVFEKIDCDSVKFIPVKFLK